MAGAVFLMVASAGYGAVSTIDATVLARIEEYVGTELTNSDEAFEDLDNSTGNLPLVAEVDFIHTGADGENAGTSATTTFNDPRLSQGWNPDPNEFGIDVSGFSQEPDISYVSICNSTETREITFTANEIGVPAGSEIAVRSFFFVDGLLVLWSKLDHVDLSGTTAEFWLTVTQVGPEDTEGTIVLQASLTLTGQSDGTVVLSTSGALTPENVSNQDLSSVVSEMGPMHMVTVPDTAIPYLYSAKVGEGFTLKAEIESKIQTQPGTGAAVALGVPLLELVGLVTDVTGSDAGTLFEEVLEDALKFGPRPAKPLWDWGETEITVVGKDDAWFLSIMPFSLCGLLGCESAILLVTFFGLAFLPLRRRH
jgi:hypothetical protein